MENNEEFKLDFNDNNVQDNNESKIDIENNDDNEFVIDPEIKAEVEEKYKKLENQIKKNKIKRYLKNLALYSVLALIAGIAYFFIQPFKNLSKLVNALIVVGIVFGSYIIYVIIEELMELYFKNKKEKGKN